MSYATHNNAVLITKDADFAALATRHRSGPQVVWIRIGNISNDALWRAMSTALDEVVKALQAGERIIEVI